MGKKMNIFPGEYFNHLAIIRAIKVKKPASAKAATIINIPNRSPIVSQLINPIASFISKILNKTSSKAPVNATTALFTFSVAISAYVSIKITIAIKAEFNFFPGYFLLNNC